MDKIKAFLKKLPPYAYFMALTLVLVVIDLITKWACQLNLTPGVPVEVIPNFFYLNLSYNTKIAFSLGIEGVGGRVINILISLVFSVGVPLYWIKKDKTWNTFYRIVAMLIFAGAVGNLIDRAFYWTGTTGFDGVIDFAQFYLGGGPSKGVSFLNPFATFNIADAYLVVGVLLLVVYVIVDAIKNRDRSLESDPRIRKEETQEPKTEESHEDDKPQQ